MTTLQRPSRPHHGAAASASLSSIDDWQSTPAAPAQQQQQQPQGPASSGVAEGLNLPADLDSPGPSMSLDAVDQALGQVQGQGQGRGQGQGQGQGFLWPPEQQQPRQQQGRHHSQAQAQQPIVNAVVCGALMHGYEQAGMWAEAVGVLSRARALGVEPNTVMFNTAIAAAGKAGQLQVCEQLFAMVTQPDLVTFETMINAYGYSGQPGPAERVYQSMLHAGFTRPRDYAYCGLIAAYTLAGDIDRALAVRQRARRAGGGEQLSLCVYNALLAACRRGQRAEAALSLLAEMKRQGLEPDAVTSQLMSEVGRQGVQSVEREQAALAAISAAMAAAGGLLIQRGLF